MSPTQAASLYGKCQWVLLHGQIGQLALSAINEQQYGVSMAECGDSVSGRIWDSLFLLQHLLSGHLPPIEYCLNLKPNHWPVIILLDAMWNNKLGPHSFSWVAWMVWFPVSNTGGELTI